jgi:protein TonB
MLVDVIVLSGENALYESIRTHVGERNPVWRARSSEEAVDMLLLGRCGVLIVDMASVSTQPASLIQRIHTQFPDVVIVVAGVREDESALAGLVSDGLIYRYMHKPLSARRAGMFLGAAIRQYTDRKERRDFEPLLPRVSRLPERVEPRYWGISAALIAGVVLAVIVLTRSDRRDDAAVVQPIAPRAAGQDAPRADPVLSRARAALAAGRYETPEGRNALDLYRAVLLAKPEHAEARAGLERTLGAIVGQAETLSTAGDRPEAQRLLHRVLEAEPGYVPAQNLLASLEPPPVAAAVEVAPEPAVPAVAPATEAGEPTKTPLVEPPTAPATNPAPVRSTRPAPDPLQPKLAMTTPKRTTTRSRSFGTPVDTGHAVAGIDTRPTVVEPQRRITSTDDAIDARQSPVSPLGASASGSSGAPPAYIDARELEQTLTVQPDYPAAAMRAGQEGWVTLEFTVSERGDVRDMLVTDSEPADVFDSAALAAVGQWRFKPRVANGRPVAMRSSVTLRFAVDR